MTSHEQKIRNVMAEALPWSTKDAQIAKLWQGVRECDAFIAKEAPRAADLRPASVVKMLEFTYMHRTALLNILAND